MRAAEANRDSSAAKITETRRAIVQAAEQATKSDRVDMPGFEVVKLVNSSAESVNVSGVTVYLTPVSAIAEAIREADEDRDWAERNDEARLRVTFANVAMYVDQFRMLAGTAIDDQDVPQMLAFLEQFRAWRLAAKHPNWKEVVQTLTLFGTLQRLYGQHLQLLELKRRNEAGAPFSNPIDIYRRRADLVGVNADQGHFMKAAACYDEALK